MSQRVPNELPHLAPGLVAREVAGDVVVVDPTTQTAHALSGLVADAWRALSSGERPVGSEHEVAAALGELAEKGLLEQSLMTRRLMLQRAGSVAVAGLVITIGLPSVHAAASTGQLAGSQTSGSATPNPVEPNAGYGMSVTVSPTSGTGTPAGGVLTIFKNGTQIHSAPYAAPYTASGITRTTVGFDDYAFSYSGDDNFGASSGSLRVKCARKLAVANVQLSWHPSNSTTAQFTITPLTGGAIPQGKLSLSALENVAYVSGTAPAEAVLDSAGKYSFALTGTGSGNPTRRLTVTFTPADGSFYFPISVVLTHANSTNWNGVLA